MTIIDDWKEKVILLCNISMWNINVWDILLLLLLWLLQCGYVIIINV